MADGSTTQTFNKVTDELGNVTGYETVVIENGKRITSKYDLMFEITSTETVEVFSDLKEIEDMNSEFQSAWDAISGNTLYNITELELRFATRDDGTILVVSEGSDEIFGRINNWTDENTWTDWNGREVTNTNYSYNFHDGNWNQFGSSGGYSRELTFEVGDERWDGEEATEAVTIADESGTHVNYRVDAPEEGADSTSWDLLNPGTDLLAYIKIDGAALEWSDITELNIGSNSWSQLDTNGATRDEAFTSSNRQIEFFVEHEDGWNEYVGRIEYRSDGFIEVRDSNWNLLARTVDLSNPDNLLKWSDLTDDTSEDYVEGLETSWDEVENYLPSAMRDNATTDADEREDLVFTKNQWGDLNVFSATGDLLVRIDSWEHDGYWESSYWDEEGNRTEGYKYNTGPSFNYHDDDWNQLARTNTQKQYFLSDEVIAASYDGTPPASFAEISLDHVTISYENGNSGFSAKKSDLETVWDGLIKDSYDVPAVAASVEGIWAWADITSLFISTDYWKDYDAAGEETNSDENKRVEYRAEGFWFESEGADSGNGGSDRWKFVTVSDHDVEIHGALDQLHTHEGMLGVVEYRDGFIEVRDSNWNTIGRFADAANAEGFDTFATNYEGLEAAWDAVTAYLPSEWGERVDLKFTADDDNNILVMNATGILLGRINVWLDTTISDDGLTIHQGSNFSFQDANYHNLARYNSYEREESNVLKYSDIDVSTTFDVDELSDDDKNNFSPISNTEEISIEIVDFIWTYESTETNYNNLGEITSTNKESSNEYFSYDVGNRGKLIATQEDMGGIINLYDAEAELVATSMSEDLINPNFLGPNTPAILENWLDVYGEQLDLFTGDTGTWSLMQTEAGAIALLLDGNIFEVGNTFVENVTDEVEWSIRFSQAEAEFYGQNAIIDNDDDELNLSLTEHRVDFQIQLFADDDELLDNFNNFIATFSPPSDVDLTGTPAEGFDFSKLESINYRIKQKDYDGTGDYNTYTEVSFIPYNEWGGSDWEHKVTVSFKSGMFAIQDSNHNDIPGVNWFDSDIDLSTPDFLGSNTQAILDNWFDMHETELGELLGSSGAWSMMQTQSGDLALLLNDKIFDTRGELEVEDPNSNDEAYWNIWYGEKNIGIGGWNGTTTEDGEYDISRNGVRLTHEYYPDDEDFDDLVKTYAPEEDVIADTDADSFGFQGVKKIALNKWYNDFDASGIYSERTELSFVPSDEFGEDDWNSKLSSELRDGVFTLRGNDWDDVIASWLNIETIDTSVSYSDYETHVDILNSILGDNNEFELSNYSLINNSLLAIDVDGNGSTDMYVNGAVNDENWQQLFSPNTLQQIGGIYKGSDSHYARLPSDFTEVSDWVADFKLSLEDLSIDDADTISDHLSDIMQRNLDVQVHFWKGTEEGKYSESIGLSFQDGTSRVGRLWIEKLADGSFKISFGASGVDKTEFTTSIDLYTENAGLLEAMVDLPQSDLSFDVDLNITSDVAFTDFENDIELVNDTMEKMFAGEFSYVIEDLYELGMNATEAESVSGNTYVKIASSGDIDHFLIFAGNVTTQDVNDAIEDPGSNGETLALLTGLESIEAASDATLASFELNEGSVTITNFDTGVSTNASIIIEASDLFAVGFDDLYTSVISMLYELDPNNKNGDSKLYSEITENAVIDYGLNAFKLYSGNDIVLSTFMENQETADASTTMLFDNSKVVLDSPYTNISDVMTSLVDIDFDPILAAEITAANNNSSNKVGIMVSNGDIDLMIAITNDMDQYNRFDLDTLLTVENATQTIDGFTFQSSDENYAIDIIADPNLPLDDVFEILQSDII